MSKAAPPPTRGWTPVAAVHDGLDMGSPAHAGMDRSMPPIAARAAWLPRPRGDGPSALRHCRSWLRAPPPTRGWTVRCKSTGRVPRGSPAHAGMDPLRRVCRGIWPWLPRPRGDGPLIGPKHPCRFSAPPPTRGWTRTILGRRNPGAGSPAHAGMDRRRRAAPGWRGRLPRPRGDGPFSDFAASELLGAPPPTRGWTHSHRHPGRRRAGSPAHAGMDRRRRRAQGALGRLPRPRGDGPALPSPTRLPSRAPPPTRGWTRCMSPGAAAPSGSPAHAGMDLCLPSTRARCCGLPRPRGDGPSAMYRSTSVPWAPPPTRGWTLHGAARIQAPDGSPAHAGMDRWRAATR